MKRTYQPSVLFVSAVMALDQEWQPLVVAA